MCDEFYLTLVSNNLTDSNNTIAYFSTSLPRRMEFDSSWRVGLSDISFTKSWFNIQSDASVILIDDKLQTYQSSEVVKAGFYATEKALESALKNVLGSVAMQMDFKKQPSVDLDIVSRRVRIGAGILRDGDEHVKPWVDAQLANMLGLEVHESNQISIKGGFKSIRAYDLNAGIHSIFAYCDIIEPSFVGDSFSQVIRSVSIPETPFGQECVVHYNPVQYHRLNKEFFDRIEIQLCDDSGELIPFEFGRSKLTLHFKRHE